MTDAATLPKKVEGWITKVVERYTEPQMSLHGHSYSEAIYHTNELNPCGNPGGTANVFRKEVQYY